MLITTAVALGWEAFMAMSASHDHGNRKTFEVGPDVFRMVYDSPASLPGRDKWVTPEGDVRRLEELLGMDADTIGAPLWVSADSRHCGNCGRTVSWLDIVSSALTDVHSRAQVASVILGDRKWVNIETPEAIEGVRCIDCGTTKLDIRAFKCHNWAYAIGDLEEVVRRVEQR
ncbi:hypothetical protein [Nocardia sp. SC052]|uniref:hypothetical protein n=1 Tax=Nocardia sichangensis TaxID=3385975 RepID=UPI0039A1A6CF